ncbi:MAG: D-2-hydroxyacid dehydrogenase [Ruminococcaceae bacterium]|nr:D-2-hydroxyacid dehydrogenase [Oscillospiraceae bacterium]
MKKIGVYVDFMNDTFRSQIEAAANSLGFSVEFCADRAELAAQIREYEVVYGHIPPELLKQATKLRWLCSDYAGIEKYLPDAVWPSADCLLSNSSGAYGPTISEHIVMVLLMLLRRMPEYQTELAQRQWTYHTPIRSVIGSHIVLLGTGDIGCNTARRLKAMGASVTGVCRSGKCEEPAFDQVLPISELESVLPQADALIMSVPFTSATAGILSRERIALLPESAFVINVGRGATIDQEALVEALQQQRIAGAALDVMVPEPLPADHPLWSCPNTIITPHCSGNMSLGLTCQLTVQMFLEDLRRYATGEPMHNLVDRKIGY